MMRHPRTRYGVFLQLPALWRYSSKTDNSNPMKLASWNVNGIRAAQKNGFLKWFEDEKADVVCVQEIKATQDQLDEHILNPGKYFSFWHPAQKPGYSGVAIFSKKEPLSVVNGLARDEFDSEGRVMSAEFPDFILVNAYFPNSQREHTRLGYKLSFCKEMLGHCDRWVKKGKNVILCGDYNIAHRPIDLRNPKQNEKNAGYLPEERAWMETFLTSGYSDIFRHFNPGPDHYTWWSYRPGVRAKNIGWRLDYHCINNDFKDRIQASYHRPQVVGSDHCPVILEIKK